jgi:aryl-alcohol dehydrogenase-like predicted oxidoreductase
MGENFQRNLDVVAEVQRLATARGCSAAQLALAWLLQRGPDIVPIPGSTRIENVIENAGALEITLTPDELAALEALAPRVAGERYMEGGMKLVNG